MTEPKDIVRKLLKDGMTETQIVEALKNLDVDVTQATINRIKHGKQRTSFDIGHGLERLHTLANRHRWSA